MKTTNFIHHLFLSALIIVLGSCVPKATENKAVCGTNQAFNSVSRTCVSVVALRARPIGTLTSATLSQETAKTLTLSYKDANSDTALSCKVSSVSANIEVVSPQVLNGRLFTVLDDLGHNAKTLASMTAGVAATAPEITDLTNQSNTLQAAIDISNATYTYSNLINQLDVINLAVAKILSDSNSYIIYSNVQHYLTATKTSLAAFQTFQTSVLNRCDCSGGVCTTSVAPRMLQNGSAGFSYTITDVDGEGDARPVSLSISATAKTAPYLAPVADSKYVTLVQSATHDKTKKYTITLPGGRDYTGATTMYAFAGTISSGKGQTTYKSGLHGQVYDCMDLTGTTGTTDLTCTYVPYTTDDSDITTPLKATVDIDEIRYTARTQGTYGNNITIQYFDLKNDNTAVDTYSSKAEKFGLVSQATSAKDVYVRVAGDAIQIFFSSGITTSSDIMNAIALNTKANSLVATALTPVNNGGANFPDPASTATSATNLAGGTDAYDSFPIKVSNGSAYSTNTATVMIKMSPVDHAPLTPGEYNTAYMGESTLALPAIPSIAEGTATGTTIQLPYKDTDLDPAKAVQCAIDFTGPPAGLQYEIPTTCTCVAGVCSASVVPLAFFNGVANFSYQITTFDQYSAVQKSSGWQPLSMTVWEVNDPPTMSLVSSTTTTLGTQVAPFAPLQTQENSTTTPSQTYICFTATKGGGSDENSQVLSFFPSQTAPTSNAALVITFGTILAPGVAGNSCAGGQYMLPFTTTANQSGTTNITVYAKDNGTTHGSADFQSSTPIVIPVLVNMVDDPPYFAQTITSVQTNEGGMVVAGPFKVDEDQANSPDEDKQAITIATITSDNSAVLPPTAISVFYDKNDNGVEDAGETRYFGTSTTSVTATDASGHAVTSLDLAAPAADDVKAHSFYLKLKPVAGVSGNANISIYVNDGNPSTATPTHFPHTTFSLIVNPVAAIHGGWTNISAVGIKTDKSGAPAATSDVVCNFNRKTTLPVDIHACDIGDCSAAGAPNGSVVPDAANVIYWDNSNKRCYRSLGNDKFSWVELKTTCPITRTASTDNYIQDTSISATVPSPSGTNLYYYDAQAVSAVKSCIYSIEDPATPGTYIWSNDGSLAAPYPMYYTPSKVTISWNQFILSGSAGDLIDSIAGWNVYRREAGQDYDYIKGFMKTSTSSATMTITDPSTTTFTDKTAIAGKVYYYEVRPVDNNHKLPTYTPEVFSEIRVIAPTPNYSFVHRWMVNQEICNSMHMTTATTNKVDPSHNYRCPYIGPGDVLDSGNYYYDIGKDMLVDISESGCPYTAAPVCDSVDGCTGIGSPNGSVAAAVKSIYYDRNTGSCYINTDGNQAWSDYNSAGAAVIAGAKPDLTNTALNAPLVNVKEATAATVCGARQIGSTYSNALKGSVGGGVDVLSTAPLSLPTKLEYIAYSAAPLGMTDSVITDLEQGFSLNAQSRCNSSSANGLSSYYTDSNVPSTSFSYTLPGTASSGIRSLYTGSVPWASDYSTETCSSRYGTQDVYGNVAEWVQDRMTCNAGGSGGDSACNGDAGILGSYKFNNNALNPYGFNLSTGPYNDITSPPSIGVDDGFLTQWLFRDKTFSADLFSFPIGMPIASSIPATYPEYASILRIGFTNGITTAQLHEDGIIINATSNEVGHFAQGGSYLSGNYSGRYTSEFIDDAGAGRPDVGFRCYFPVAPANYPKDSFHPYTAY